MRASEVRTFHVLGTDDPTDAKAMSFGELIHLLATMPGTVVDPGDLSEREKELATLVMQQRDKAPNSRVQGKTWRSLEGETPPKSRPFFVRSQESFGERTYGIMWYYEAHEVGFWHSVGSDADEWDSATVDVAEAGCPFAEWMEIPS